MRSDDHMMETKGQDVSAGSTPLTEVPRDSSKAPQRVLACSLCQSRKIKCDRKTPCSNCVRSGVQCTQAVHTHRQRRRRFPERELLEKLRHYESLLRQNNIRFDPLHPTSADKPSPGDDSKSGSSPNDGRDDDTAQAVEPVSTDGQPTPASTETVNYWRALNSKVQDPGDDDDADDEFNDNASTYSQNEIHEETFRKAWDLFSDNTQHLLFGSSIVDIDITILRPPPVQIFQLWQIYLDNVNPLLKVTHTPTLQASIVEAASNATGTSPTLEALMFSIYCMAIISLTDAYCQTTFNQSKNDMLRRFQFGCQQSLLKSEFLRSDDRHCLTALHLYLISVKPDTDPRSLSSMLGIAIRMAERMGIHLESSYTKLNALEAEMRRRLWWSLIIFDNRICEMCSYSQATMLIPTWDCRPPLNVNDVELRPEMKNPPTLHAQPTEALFVVVRSELSNFVRCSDFYLDFINPFLKGSGSDKITSTTNGQDQSNDTSKLTAFGRVLETKYLSHCDPSNSLHYMTLWTTRMHYNQARMLEYYSLYARPTSTHLRTDSARDAAVLIAISMIEHGTLLASSPLTKGFLWYISSHFPFPAYIHILQDFRKRPLQPWAERGWAAMSENWWYRFSEIDPAGNPFFKIFAKIVMAAWGAREKALVQAGFQVVQPKMVGDVLSKMPATEMGMGGYYEFGDGGGAGGAGSSQPDVGMNLDIDDLLKFLPTPMVNSGQGVYSFDQQPALADPATWGYADPLNEASIDFDLNLNQVDWSSTI